MTDMARIYLSNPTFKLSKTYCSVAVALPKSEDVIKITKELFKSIEALGYYKKFNETIGITMEMLFYDEGKLK